jgi:hypothetical protein
MTISFDTMRDDLPPNVADVRIQPIALHIVRSDGQPFAQSLAVSLYFTPQGGTEDSRRANSKDGIFNSRWGNASEWLNKI